jgi:O-antigen ligase
MTGAPPGRLLLGGSALLLMAGLLAWAPGALLGLLTGAALSALIWLSPILGLILAAWGVPFGSALPTSPAAGAVTLTPLFLLWAAAGWLLGRLGAGATGIPRVPVLIPLLGYVALLLVAASRAPEPLQAAFEIGRWVELGLALFLAAVIARQPHRHRLLLAALLAAGAAAALAGIAGSLSPDSPEAFAIQTHLLGRPLSRAYGTFGQPNPFGGFMNMIWPIALGLTLAHLTPPRLTPTPHSPHSTTPPARSVQSAQSAHPLLQSVVAVSAALAAIGLLLSWSRGAWLAAAVAAAAMGLVWLAAVLRPPVPGRAVAGLWAALTIGLALLAVGAIGRVPPGIQGRLGSIAGTFAAWGVADAEVDNDNFATIERVAHWEAAAAMWAERPWLGQGPGQYAGLYPRYRLPSWPDPLGHAHNYYLHTLAEAGILGLMGFLVLFGAALRLALVAALCPRTAIEHGLGLGLTGVLAALAMHSLVDNLFVHEMTVTLGLLLGLTAAAGEVA